MKRLIYIFILALFTACGSSRVTEKITRTMVKDSTWREIQYIPVDTVFTIPGDSVRLVVPLREIGKKPIIRASKDGRTKAGVALQNDTVFVDCKVEELQRKITLLKEIISDYRRLFKTTSKDTIVRESYVPNFIKILAWFGVLLIGLIIAGAITLIKKTLKP